MENKENEVKVPKTLSKKLTLAVTSVVFLVATEKMGLHIEFETLLGVVGIIVTYIIGQSVVDSSKEATKGKIKNEN